MKKTSTIFCTALLAVMSTVAQAQAAHINLQVLDNNGGPVAGVATQLVTTQFTNVGVTDANGYLKINVPNGTSYKLKLTYNGTTAQSPAYKNVGPGFTNDTFRTSKLSIYTKSGATPVANIGVQMLDATNSWKQLGATDNNGVNELQVFAKDSMRIRAVANGSMEDRFTTPFAYGTNSGSVTFGNLVKTDVPGALILVGSSWYTPNGRYIFPGKYLVKVLGTYTDSLDITGNWVNKVPCVVIVKDHNNNPIAGVPLRGGVGTGIQWHAKPTNANGVTIDWSNGSANPVRTYEARVNVSYDTIVKNTTLNNGQIFTFKTSLLVLNLQDCNGGGIPGGHVRYGKGAINSHFPNGAGVNTNAAGETTAELFPGTYVLEMGINQGTRTTLFVFNGTNSFTWNTVNATSNYGGAVSYSNGSNPAGNTGWFAKSGTPLLPGNYYFKFNGVMPVVKAVTIVPGCTQSVDSLPNANKVTGIDDVPGVEFSVYPNPATDKLAVVMPTGGNVRIVAIDGRTVSQNALNSGLNTIEVSTLAPGVYTIIATHGNEVATQRITKQ